jgi:methylmalonyl-CoA mutase C-terminal domain/subunit
MSSIKAYAKDDIYFRGVTMSQLANAAVINHDDSPYRALITKIGLDGHDRGSRIVAAYLRDAGMEVIYTPPWQEIQSVVQLALQEDVDLIGVSTLATDHLIIPDMMAALREAGLDSVAVFIGGIIPEQERPMLLEAGVRAIFGPGSLRDDIVGCARELASEARVKKYQSFGG